MSSRGWVFMGSSKYSVHVDRTILRPTKPSSSRSGLERKSIQRRRISDTRDAPFYVSRFARPSSQGRQLGCSSHSGPCLSGFAWMIRLSLHGALRRVTGALGFKIGTGFLFPPCTARPSAQPVALTGDGEDFDPGSHAASLQDPIIAVISICQYRFHCCHNIL